MIRAALLLLGLPLLSCGYEIGHLYDERYKEVKVEILGNDSERRTHEFDLTNVIVHEMAARGIRVNASGAPYTLRGRIADIRTPSVVDQLNTDVLLVGSLLFAIEIQLVGPDGKVVWADVKSESVAFATSRGEAFESARAEVFDRLARWVVAHFEKEW